MVAKQNGLLIKLTEIPQTYGVIFTGRSCSFDQLHDLPGSTLVIMRTFLELTSQAHFAMARQPVHPQFGFVCMASAWRHSCSLGHRSLLDQKRCLCRPEFSAVAKTVCKYLLDPSLCIFFLIQPPVFPGATYLFQLVY